VPSRPPIHRPRQPDAPRIQQRDATANERQQRRALRTNSTAWRKLRAQVLTEQPLCPDCEAIGHTRAAREVDHADGNAFNNDRSNLVGRCKPCHSRKTAREMGRKPIKGCDINGIPLDPNHHWNRDR
jgi:5-methylcytosine-specific restriction protein A